MYHLKMEDMARLVDESPSDIEAAHLAACTGCSFELEQLKVQTARLARLPDPAMPEMLRKRIASVLEGEPIKTPMRTRIGMGWSPIAASVMIFVLGSATGTYVIAPKLGEEATPAPSVAAGPEPADAAATLAAAESEYLQALAHFARLNYSGDGLDPLNRLAALEGIVLTTRAALREAPADPVINNYHLTALGQRNELLRQIEEVEGADEWF